MSQTFEIPVDNAAPLGDQRADFNNALLALQSVFSGATEPSAPAAFMLWVDTAIGWVKQRNAANSAWNILYPANFATGVMGGPGFNVGRKVFYTDSGNRLKIIDLPTGMVATGGGIYVKTAFNGSAGANLMNIGWGLTTPSEIAIDVNVASVGVTAANGPKRGEVQTSARTIDVLYEYAGGGAGVPTQGEAFVWITGMAAP